MGKYTADYFQCNYCGFIQTEQPYWLNEAYVSAITSIDVGLIHRNLVFSGIIPSILDMFSSEKDAYVDYGGGYGMFVRIMRDKGYDFYLQDLYADNLFAKYFELKDHTGKGKFAALTAFEVFEHLEDPVQELEKMFALSDTVIFSTDIQPKPTFNNTDDWWYFTPETGQHIALYTVKALESLSRKFSCSLYTNGNNLHVLSRAKLLNDPFAAEPPVKRSLLSRIAGRLSAKPQQPVNTRSSLLPQDFELYKRHAFKK